MSRTADSPRRVRRRRTSATREMFTVVAVAILLSWLLKTFLLQAFLIPSESMENTLRIGDRILVDKRTAGDVRRGDVVVFEDPGGWLPPPDVSWSPFALVGSVTEFLGLSASSGGHVVKRVIGMPGDHVTCCNGRGQIMINGLSLEEPYLFPGDVASATPFDVWVPPDNYWVMGDHRSRSGDSREHRLEPDTQGFVPKENVVGRAFAVVWPTANMTRLRRPEVFESPRFDTPRLNPG